MNLLVLFITFIFLFTVENATYIEDLTAEKAQYNAQCVDDIICKAKRPDEFMRTEDVVKDCPSLIADVKGNVKTIYGLDDFYTQAIEGICPLTKPERMEQFFDLGQQAITGLGKSNCEFEESDICKCYDLGFDEYDRIIQEYTDKGVCGNPEGAMKDGAKEAQNMGMGSMMG